MRGAPSRQPWKTGRRMDGCTMCVSCMRVHAAATGSVIKTKDDAADPQNQKEK